MRPQQAWPGDVHTGSSFIVLIGSLSQQLCPCVHLSSDERVIKHCPASWEDEQNVINKGTLFLGHCVTGGLLIMAVYELAYLNHTTLHCVYRF